MSIDDEIQGHEKRIVKLEECTTDISRAVAGIQGSMGTIELLVKWVITPLLIIVGSLVGINLYIP